VFRFTLLLVQDVGLVQASGLIGDGHSDVLIPLLHEEGELLVPLGPTVRRRAARCRASGVCGEAHSLKLEEVAENLGLAPSTLSRIETGKAPTKSAYLTGHARDCTEVKLTRRAPRCSSTWPREGHRKGLVVDLREDVLCRADSTIYVGLEGGGFWGLRKSL